MLVTSRRVGESIVFVVGETRVTLRIEDVRKRGSRTPSVKMSIAAPREISVRREELLKAGEPERSPDPLEKE